MYIVYNNGTRTRTIQTRLNRGASLIALVKALHYRVISVKVPTIAVKDL